MIKINKHIEIVGSSDPRLNSMAKDSRLTVLKVLSKHYSKVGVTLVDNMADLEDLVGRRPDLVVLGMRFVLLEPSKSYGHSPKVWLASYLKQHGINFAGSDAEALAIQLEKPIAKQKVIDAGLHTADFFVSKKDWPTYGHDLKFPLFVKPTNRGGSKGIDEKSIVYSQPELESKIQSINDDCLADALVEEYLSGREFSVAVIKQPESSGLLALPVEIKSPPDKKGNSFLSAAVKKADAEKVVAVMDPIIKTKVSALAIGAFEALGARDYGRIDIRLDSAGTPCFIEANLRPGLSNHGYLARCFYINEGRIYEEMILSIVQLALARNIGSVEEIHELGVTTEALPVFGLA